VPKDTSGPPYRSVGAANWTQIRRIIRHARLWLSRSKSSMASDATTLQDQISAVSTQVSATGARYPMNEQAAHESHTEELLDGELIDSRALESEADDRFRHADLVAELVALVRTVPTPANVALFAPWGSGKSGMGNMIEAQLKDDRHVRFVKFDAFKFGEAPLRRHFISQMAKGLGQDDKEFSTDLYQATMTRDIRLPGRDVPKLVLAFVETLIATILLLFALALVVAVVSKGGFSVNWSSVAKYSLLPALPLATIGTIFIKLATDGLKIDSFRGAPSGDEEFEHLFKALVEKTMNRRINRIVVFVDELDRCSPDEVTSTLETIKTFLEVEGCVFIVAADHQVLEQALRKSVRQETPVDSANPYYSAGSSYLDKIFQYQYQLPPLKSDRLTEFALALVRDRKGVWERVQNLPEVVSVLIPTHVTSPRRVKVLLNSFALTYRLAERRQKQGVLGGDLSARASEIAKLVCLRCEFPLFAEDLTLDEGLPDLVRAIADGEKPPGFSPREVITRATNYAHNQLPVAEYLVDKESRAPYGPERKYTARDGYDVAKEAEEETEAAEAESEGDNTGAELDPVYAAVASEVTTMTVTHGRQLVRYLRKVAYIPGPNVDLIYLESAGVLVGLPPSVADTLRRAAVDHDFNLVRESVEPLNESEQRAAVKLLAGLVRDAPVGVEGQNAVSTLLSTISGTSLRLADVAEEVATAVAGHQRQIKLRPEDLSGALIVGIDSGRAMGKQLRDQVLGDSAALERTDVAEAAVCRAASVPEKFDEALGHAATTLLVKQDDDRLINTLREITDEQASRVLGMTLEPMLEAIKGAAPAEGENPAVQPIADRLAVVMRGLSDNNQPLAMLAAVTLAVRSGEVPIHRAAFSHLAELEPITDEMLIISLMDTARRYVTKDWPNIIGRIAPSALASSPDVGTQVARVAQTLWARRVKEDGRETDEHFDAGLAILAKFMTDGVPVDRDSLRETVGATLAGPFTTDVVSNEQAHALEVARRFVGAGMLEKQTLADIDANCCIATLESAMPPDAESESQQVAGALYRRSTDAAQLASAEVLERLDAAIEPTPWWSEAEKASGRLIVASARHRVDGGVTASFSPGELAQIRARDGESFDQALVAWLDGFKPSPTEIWGALGDLANGSLPDVIAEALRARAGELSASEKFELAKPALDDPARTPGSSFLRAIRFAEADHTQVVGAIKQIASEASTTTRREAALSLWGEFTPTRQTTQERLVKDVYLPIVRRGGEDLDIAISHFGLVSGQKGATRKTITEALRTSNQNDEQHKRIENRLKEADWLKRGGILGLGSVEKVDED
jgi:KAP family P-loop domain